MIIFVLDAATSTIQNSIVAFATQEWMIYLASGIAFLASTSTTVMRSMITKIVPSTETGRVFCVVEFLKAILPFGGLAIFGKLYAGTVGSHPNAFLFLSISLKFTTFVIVLIIYLTMRRQAKQEKEDMSLCKTKGMVKRAERDKEEDKILEEGTSTTNKQAINLLSKDAELPSYENATTHMLQVHSDMNNDSKK